MPSVEDPEQRHGHKSRNRSFIPRVRGTAVAVDVESQLVTAVEVIPGNEPDGESAQKLVEESEANACVEAQQVLSDTAYGSMEVRRKLGEREVIAPTVKGHSRSKSTKADFEIDVDNDCVCCPECHETRRYSWVWYRSSRGKRKRRVKRFAFDREVCRACPRYAECVTDKRRRGRFIALHPDEELLQKARALEQTEYFRDQYRQRVVVEHRIGRLVQLGIRKSRFFGRAKTESGVLMAAAVANLTLVANRLAPEGMFCGFLRRLLGRLWALTASLALMCRFRATGEKRAATVPA